MGTLGLVLLPLGQVSLDVDRDGEPEALVLERSGQLRIDGELQGTGGWLTVPPEEIGQVGFEAQQVGERRVVVVRAEHQGRPSADAAVWLQGEPARLLWAGVVGPQGVDGEWSRVLQVTGQGIVVYEERPGVTRCDGAPSLLFPLRYDFQEGRMRPVSAPLEVPADATPLTARRGLAPSGLGDDVPAAFFRATAASSQPGATSAAALAPPREIDDGDPSTTWSENTGGFGRGTFVTLRSRGGTREVRALRLVHGETGPPLARALVLVDKRAFDVSFPRGIAGGPSPLWIELPAPVRADCVSLVIADVHGGAAAKKGRTAIGELAVLTADDGGDVLGALARRLLESDRHRTSALRVLEARPAEGTAVLLRALDGTTDAKQRTRGRVALAHLADPGAVPELARALAEESDPSVYADALGRMAAYDRLAAVLTASDASVQARQSAARVLGERGQTAPLVAVLGEGPRALRRTVIHALVGMDSLAPEIFSVIEATSGGAKEIDAWGTLVLRAREHSVPADIAALVRVRLATATDVELRYRLAQMAGALASEAARSLLGADGDPVLRRVLVDELPRGTGELAALALGDDDPGVRIAAARKLESAKLGPSAVNKLAALLRDDRWPVVRRHVAHALRQSCGAAAEDALYAAAASDPSPDTRRVAIAGLVECEATAIDDWLLALVANESASAELRVYAAEQLGVLGRPGLAAAVVPLYADVRSRAVSSRAHVRIGVALARSLGHLGGTEAQTQLVRTLEEGPSSSLRAAAAEALGTLCTPAARRALSGARPGGDPLVARSVRLALGACRR